MNTKYIKSADGANIAYTVSGQGDALILLHGAGRTKEVWQEYGWIDEFKNHFTTIAIDIRGYGESDKSYDTDFYSIDHILSDIKIVVATCGFDEFFYFGHSYGATIGLQAIRAGMKIKKAVLASASFGDSFFKVTVPEWITEYEKMNIAKKSNSLNTLDLQPEDINWIENSDLDNYLAQFNAWNKWSGVQMDQIQTETAIYSGSKDNPDVVQNIVNNKKIMEQFHIKTKIFDNLNHSDLVTEKDVCYPWVYDFLSILWNKN